MDKDLFSGGNQIASSAASLAQNAAVAVIFFLIVVAICRSKGAIPGLISALVCGALGWYIVKLGGIADVATLLKDTFQHAFK